MPIGNNFQHASYARSDPGERVSYREFQPGAPPDSLAWQDAMAAWGDRVSQAGVRAVLFLHGTFLSSDLFGVQRLDEAGGLKRGYSRGIPGMKPCSRSCGKGPTDCHPCREARSRRWWKMRRPPP